MFSRRCGWQDVLRNERAEYGKQVVEGLSARLTEEFGPGFTKANILHMLRFAEAFPEREIVYTLCRQWPCSASG
jgi:hypothetical protein